MLKPLIKLKTFLVYSLSFLLLSMSLVSCIEKSCDKKYLVLSDTILTPSQRLGKNLFFDENLSNPKGRSCASCHMPEKGFVDSNMPISHGAIKNSFGNRNSMPVSYTAFTPHFHYDSVEQTYVGGLFWDGRAKTLSEQAIGPLLSHNEMNNMDINSVVNQVRHSKYKDLFLYVFGTEALNDTEKAFVYITEALEEYEESKEINPFTSKFDYYQKGLVEFTESEIRGLKLFNDSTKGNCAAYHPSTRTEINDAILFTDHTYDNLGIPANPEINKLNKSYKQDLGLGAFVQKTSENGKFKVPTLRNVSNTAPYFHNGIFKTLEEVVKFYNERDSGKFGRPEVEENMNKEELGNLKLTQQEMEDIVAFMETLTDGYNINNSTKK